MNVMVLLEAPVKVDEIANMTSYLAEILPDTRAYDGCQGMEVYFSPEKDGDRVMR